MLNQKNRYSLHELYFYISMLLISPLQRIHIIYYLNSRIDDKRVIAFNNHTHVNVKSKESILTS